MDELFELYNAYYDRLVDGVRRAHQGNPERNPASPASQRMTRDDFEQYLLNGRESESKRLFLRRVLEGNQQLTALLPDDLKSLASRAA